MSGSGWSDCLQASYFNLDSHNIHGSSNGNNDNDNSDNCDNKMMLGNHLYAEHECLIESILFPIDLFVCPRAPINWFIWAIVPPGVMGNSIEAVQCRANCNFARKCRPDAGPSGPSGASGTSGASGRPWLVPSHPCLIAGITGCNAWLFAATNTVISRCNNTNLWFIWRLLDSFKNPPIWSSLLST